MVICLSESPFIFRILQIVRKGKLHKVSVPSDSDSLTYPFRFLGPPGQWFSVVIRPSEGKHLSYYYLYTTLSLVSLLELHPN